MKKILLAFLLVPLFSFSQNKISIVRYEHDKMRDAAHHRIVYWIDILILSNGDTVGHGTILTLGKGTLPNGDYNFIATGSNSMEAKLKHTTMLKTLTVDEVKQKGKAEYGYKYIVIVQGKYLVQLEDAIATGEIILDNKLATK